MKSAQLTEMSPAQGSRKSTINDVAGYLYHQITRHYKLSVQISDFELFYLQREAHGISESNQITSRTSCVTIRFKINLHNSSSVYKNASKIHLLLKGEFMDFRYPVLLMGAMPETGIILLTDRLHNIDIPPRSASDFGVNVFIQNDGIKIMSSQKHSIYLVYAELNSFKRVLLKRCSPGTFE